MLSKNPRSGGARASVCHQGDDSGKLSKFTPTPQLLALTSGGLLDIDSAADALAWGRALEADAAHFLHRRRHYA